MFVHIRHIKLIADKYGKDNVDTVVDKLDSQERYSENKNNLGMPQ